MTSRVEPLVFVHTLVLCFDDLSAVPENFVQANIRNGSFVGFVQWMNGIPHVTLIIQSVPAIVARVTNAVNITSLIIEGILVGAVVAGLLHSIDAPHNGEFPATTVLAHFPLAMGLRI